WAGSPGLEEARKLYQLSDFEKSLAILQKLPQKDAAVWGLIWRHYYGQADLKKATGALVKALAEESNSSEIETCLRRGTRRRRADWEHHSGARLCFQGTPIFRKGHEIESGQPGGPERPVRVLSRSAGISRRWLRQGLARGGADVAH